MWRPHEAFRDRSIPKLHRLVVAARAGLEVPPTVWCRADAVDQLGGELGIAPSPAGWVVRSGAPDEDGGGPGCGGSLAGRYTSVHVPADADAEMRRAALSAVQRSLGGRGVVFVQPKIVAARAGVAFFDGFWFERSEVTGDNAALTHGERRGDVARGHLEPDDAFSRFLVAVKRTIDAEVIDLEYAVSGGRYTLLQVRPAGFSLARNPLLSVANHREILGEVPSPWITSVLEHAGRTVGDWFAAVDPEVARWDEHYAIVVHGRPWMNFSFFYRLMDHWGLPRRWVTAGVGGAAAGDDRRERLALGRLKPWAMLRLQGRGLVRIASLSRGLDAIGRRVRAARTLPELFAANVAAMEFAVSSNFAINGFLTGWQRLRRAFDRGVEGSDGDGGAPLVTSDMMHAFDRLRALPESERAAGLARWLEAYGHRGPLESDPERPRFSELGDRLAAELAASARAAAVTRVSPPPADMRSALRELLFLPDRLRERFRDDLMRVWQELRAAILAAARDAVAAGSIARAEDAFLLSGDDLEAPPAQWSRRVEEARALRAVHESMLLPVTADLDVLLAAQDAEVETGALQGVGIGGGVVRGEVVRARELDDVLGRHIGEDAVLVVPSLEPSWAVVFPRFAAVISELGGELSHAAILLRESRRRAVVDCRGAFVSLRDGDVVVVDVAAGTVVRSENPSLPRDRSRG